MTSWDRCPKAYQLSRIIKARATPAWYFAGGTAVHQALEDLDRGLPEKGWTEYFYPEVRRLLARDQDHKSWLSGGSPEDPDQGDAWNEIGPRCIENWKGFTSEVFQVTDIELDVTCTLPGSSLPTKGFIDRLGEHVDHGRMIIDIKTGKNKPKDKGLQLGVYAALLAVSTGEIVTKGAYFMAREGKLSKVYDLTPYTPERAGAKFEAVASEVSAGKFPAKVEYSCRFCDQKLNCFAKSGNSFRTRLYDPSNPKYIEKEEIPF